MTWQMSTAAAVAAVATVAPRLSAAVAMLAQLLLRAAPPHPAVLPQHRLPRRGLFRLDLQGGAQLLTILNTL